MKREIGKVMMIRKTEMMVRSTESGCFSKAFGRLNSIIQTIFHWGGADSHIYWDWPLSFLIREIVYGKHFMHNGS